MFKKIRFEKSKYPIFKIAFWVLLLASILMIGLIIKKNLYVLNVKDFGSTVKPITINIKFKNKIDDNYFVCFDNYCKPLENNSLADMTFERINSFSVTFDNSDEEYIKHKINGIYFAHSLNNKTVKNNIENIYLNIGEDIQYFEFKDIEKLESKVVSILPDGEKEQKEYKIYKFENSNNDYDFLHKVKIVILSFVFNWIFYIVPYCWLLVAILIFVFNKDVFKFSTKTKDTILFSVFLSFVLLFAFSYFTTQKLSNGKNNLLNFVLNDSKKYQNYEIIVLAKNQEKPKNLDNINWQNIKLNKKETLKGIRKSDYTKKDKKVVIYFDSNVADVASLILKNPRIETNRTNYTMNAKLIYN